MPADPQTTPKRRNYTRCDTERDNFRAGFRQAQNAAVDRCRVEQRADDPAGNAAIERAIAAILALDTRYFR